MNMVKSGEKQHNRSFFRGPIYLFTIVVLIAIRLPSGLQATSVEPNNNGGNILEQFLNHFTIDTKSNWSIPDLPWFPFVELLLDELGVVPKEFVESGLHFTVLTPSLADAFSLLRQLMNHKHVDFANDFDRVLFGYMPPETLANKTYVRTFPGSRLEIKKVTNDTVSVGNFLVDLTAYFSFFDVIIVYYKISTEPK